MKELWMDAWWIDWWRTHGWMNEWMARQTDGWMGGWLGQWTGAFLCLPPSAAQGLSTQADSHRINKFEYDQSYLLFHPHFCSCLIAGLLFISICMLQSPNIFPLHRLTPALFPQSVLSVSLWNAKQLSTLNPAFLSGSRRIFWCAVCQEP